MQANGHGRTKHPQALVELDHLLLVQPHQSPVQQLVRAPDLAPQDQIGLNGPCQFSKRGLGQQVRAAAARRQAGQQMIQQAASRVSPDAGSLLEEPPLAPQRHPYGLGVQFPHGEAAGGPILAAAVVGDAADNAPQPFRQGIGQSLVPQDLGGNTQMQGGGVSLALVRRRLAHVRDQGGLKFGRVLQAPGGCALHAGVNERGQNGVVAGYAQPFQIVQGAAHALGTQS